MVGSGIYSTTVDREVECANTEWCDFVGSVEVYVDDRKVGTWTCPQCSSEHELDFNEMYGPDPDEAYDRMRDERGED